MREYTDKVFIRFSWFIFVVSAFVIISVQPGPAETSGKYELTLRESTVKGSVIEAMKIDIINLRKNRLEKIESQLKNQVIIRKHFFQERVGKQPDDGEPDKKRLPGK